jgi:hypothetical protein
VDRRPIPSKRPYWAPLGSEDENSENQRVEGFDHPCSARQFSPAPQGAASAAAVHTVVRPSKSTTMGRCRCMSSSSPRHAFSKSFPPSFLSHRFTPGFFLLGLKLIASWALAPCSSVTLVFLDLSAADPPTPTIREAPFLSPD